MKKLLLSIVLLFISTTLFAQPLRQAREVRDVTQSYTTMWIVSPQEEPKGDHNVTNAPGCDLRGVSAANDRNRIRIDINLYSPVDFSKKVFYAFKFTYLAGLEEWFVYIPSTSRMMYIKKKYGRLQERKEILMSKYSDWAQVTGQTISGVYVANSTVTLYLDKNKHVARQDYGKLKYLTTQFFSGFFARGTEELKEADRTISVRLAFIR